MSYLLLSSNRFRLKFPIFILYRHLSTIERSHSDQLIMTTTTTHSNVWFNRIKRNESIFFKNNYYQKRLITLHVPSSDEKSSSNRNERLKIPFQFPPGNPNDKPKLEHLRFMEDQLKQIVNVLIDS
jgi:hypothetical protein